MASAKKAIATPPSLEKMLESFKPEKHGYPLKDYPIPTSLSFMGREIPIEVMPTTWDKAGEFEEHSAKIRVLEGQAPIEEADTVLHEMIHGIDYWLQLGLSERQVRLLATALIGLFQDNPEFAEYVTRPMKGTK